MDLRREIHDIIEATGHYVLLQRKSKSIRCSCWDAKYREPLSDCPICLGTGKISRIERHKIRRETAANIISLPNHLEATAIGRVGHDTRLFFMKHDVHPKKGDIIMEVGWDKNRPTHLINQYEISFADDMREHNGRIEFYQVTAKEISVDTKIRGFTVRRLGPVQNYEAIRKG